MGEIDSKMAKMYFIKLILNLKTILHKCNQTLINTIFVNKSMDLMILQILVTIIIIEVEVITIVVATEVVEDIMIAIKIITEVVTEVIMIDHLEVEDIENIPKF